MTDISISAFLEAPISVLLQAAPNKVIHITYKCCYTSENYQLRVLSAHRFHAGSLKTAVENDNWWKHFTMRCTEGNFKSLGFQINGS